ncbi:MAG: DNA primase [Candidatus Taylorbacteria bacterium RIFCSPLOWO2_01_FULL_45_15b]|uniref:DNA primase n=1 Tax=Candidatus Taylorbacteria bacterium RIFCSPLOWO2_01_FULL_45_15b TaxID=1802319 RepID=A0A1G2NDK1_9BACT|nr:MAG: DNA primase [Candidatus Taylorbacteria bacterium RIFCSPLOWO2_01_FULL_45_15b]
MASDLEKIKEKLPIEDVVGSYLTLTPSGKYLKSRCPFHNERSASFVVSPDRGTFYCFGCQAKGDIFEFVGKFEGLDFVGSLKILAERAGVPIGRGRNHSANSNERIFSVLREAAIFYHKILWSDPGAPALEYLKMRGLADLTIKEWGIGYAPGEWRLLRDHLQKKKYSDTELESAGLTIKPPDDARKNSYDRFRSRIIFPLFDTAGRIAGFSGRIFPHDDTAAKYINSPETAVYSKSKYLYGLHKAKQEMRKQGACVAVEGQMDLLMSHQAGVGNTIAVSGTAFTEEHSAMIRRFCDTLIFALDQDAAGLGAMEKGAALALGVGMNVKVARLPLGKDPAELIARDAEAWRRSIIEAKGVIDYLAELISSDETDLNLRARAMAKKIFPLLVGIKSSMERAAFISKISGLLSVPESSVRADLDLFSKSATLNRASNRAVEASETAREVPTLAERAIGIILWQKQNKKASIDVERFHSRLTELISKKEVERIETKLIQEETRHIFEAEYHYAGEKKLEQAIDRLLQSIEIEIIKNKMLSTLEKVRVFEKDGRRHESAAILGEYKALSDRLSAISKKQKVE